MEHGHNEHKHDKLSESKAALKKLVIVSIVCIIFCAIEFFGGYFSGSMAIMTDAAHLLSDFSGFVISMISVWIGSKEANRRLSFGFHRAEVIGALASVILIWGLTLILVLEAIDRIINPVEVDGQIMLITATLGLIFNLIMVKVLHSGDGHSHHGCSHSHDNERDQSVDQATYEMEEMDIENIELGGSDENNDETLGLKHHDSLDEPEVVGNYSKSFDIGSDKLDHQNPYYDSNMNRSSVFDYKSGRNERTNDTSKTMEFNNNSHLTFKHGHYHGESHSTHDNLNVRAAAIHIVGDIIQSVGVLLAALFIYAFPGWDIIDPICTFMFSILVIFTTYFIVKDCMLILLEGVPNQIKYDHVKMALQRIEGVTSVKELHIWTLTSGKYCCAAKLVAKHNNPVVIQAHEVCKSRFKITRCFIEVNTI